MISRNSTGSRALAFVVMAVCALVPVSLSALTCSSLELQCPDTSVRYYASVASPLCETGGYYCATALTNTLWYRTTGAQVRSLQTQLVSLGYLSADSSTGYFGALTRAAVRRFQCESGLVCSGDENSTGWGLVGRRTRERLLSRGIAVPSAPPASPAPVTSPIVVPTNVVPQTSSALAPSAPPAAPVSVSPSASVSADPAPCFFQGVSVAHGQSVIAYKDATVPAGSQCMSEQRTCSNGTLSGSFAYASCTVQSSVATCTALPAQTQTTACPSGQTGSITLSRSSSCPSGAATPVWGSWATTTSTCVLATTTLVTFPGVMVGFWRIGGLLADPEYISETVAQSNVMVFPPGKDGAYAPRVAKAASLGAKSMLMVQWTFFDKSNLFPDWKSRFDTLWASLGDQQQNVVGFYLKDEPYANNGSLGAAAIPESTLKANLDAAASYIHQKAPGRQVAMTETPANANRTDLFSLIPDSIDLIGVNCYLATGEQWCSESKIAGLIAKLASGKKAHQKLIVTADGYWPTAPTAANDAAVRDRIIFWENLLAPYLAANQIGAITPFIYQTIIPANVHGIVEMPQSLAEMTRYMTSIKKGAPAPASYPNLALNKTATSSKQYQAQSPNRAFDGLTTTAWNAGGFPTQWIQVDLGSANVIHSLRLVVAQSPVGPTTHSVYGSLSGAAGSWQAITTFAGTTSTGQALSYSLAVPTSYRFIKVETTRSPSWVAWTEIEVR